MEEVRISDWPEPPGSHAWLPAYGFQHDIMDKDDYFGTNGDNGSTHALYLETIVEETSDDLRSEKSSGGTWLSDSDADSVIHVPANAGSECDSESEREWACPAKRRRRERDSSPASSDSLSRSSSLAQFESLERSCAAPASPSLSPDSLESPPPSPPPTRVPATRTHLSAENLSEDSGYSERSRRPPPPAHRRPPEIAQQASVGAGSEPCLAISPSPERRPPRTARALSLPAELDVCAEPRRHAGHRSRFRQSFEVSDSLTVSVADLTALDYRGGTRRPRLPPPPPPPRAPRHPPPPPPPPVEKDISHESVSPIREPSAGSDSTTESERAFAREMELTARRLDESARRVLSETGDYDRELSVLTAKRMRDSWGAWDDVLDELRRRIEPSSPTPSPPRSPSPDPVRQPAFTSTPLRSPCDARVRSTPELRARATPHRETPEELRASLQLVATPPPGTGPPARSVSAGSKGVTFSPVVAEVSWRETSTSTTESESTASDDADDAEVEVVVEGGSEEPRAPASDRSTAMTEASARAPRGRIAGFLSRFANFRFSGRKEKKTRGAGANGRPPAGGPALAADAGQAGRAAGAGPQYVRIPLKEEGVSRTAAPPAAGGVAHKPPRPRPPPAPAAGVLETDVDTQRTVLHARSLLALAPPDQRAPRPHKSMEFLLDKESAQAVQPPENELQKNSDRVLSEHELRVQRSLQKLNVPEWYKNAPAPREGFLLRKRLSDASASAARWSGLNSKTTSLGSLGAANAQPPPPQLSPHTTSFGRWSTSRLNSNQTSPCSSTRSSIRGTSPLCSPSTRSSFSARQPYLGWRSQERLNSTPRTPHERLASSLLQQSAASSRASEEIQSSIKEVTSAIVHYVSGLEPANGDIDREPSPRSSQKLCWLESSFVGTKPLDSPQTPLVVSEALPPPHPRPPSSLRLDHRATPDWQDSQRSLNLGIARPSPGSTTLEDVLDSLLGLPSQPTRLPTPQPSPRKTSSPYYLTGGKSPRYEQLVSSGHSSTSPASRFMGTPSEEPSSFTDPSPDHDRPGKDTVDTPAAMPEPRRSRSAHGEHSRRKSEPFAQHSASVDRRTSLDAAALRPNDQQLTHHDSKTSLASLQTENSTDDAYVRCKYPKCSSRALLSEAKRHYKACHNCTTMYCSRECRRAHWEKHRKVCLHSRASALCRQIISAAKEDADSLHQISTIAHKGYLSQGRGVVKVFFTSPESAEKFTNHGFQYLTEPEYMKWTSLQPNEMGVELYTEVVKLCKTYNPETRVILYVAVCIISEVPTKGAVKWERQMVSRCAKLRLSKTVTVIIQEQYRRRQRRNSKNTPDEWETLILTSKMDVASEKNAATAHKFREICFYNILKELESRGVVLKKHFPEVYSRLTAYVDGTSDRFIPMTIYPKDVSSGKSFMCIIIPDNDIESGTPTDGKVTTVDVGIDRSRHQLSTPM